VKVGTTIHVSVSVKGALLAPASQQRRVFDTLTNDGKPCASVEEYRSVLADLLADGIKHLPMGKPCEGFSYETGCPGHDAPQEPPQ
jgi:hypothetical protein